MKKLVVLICCLLSLNLYARSKVEVYVDLSPTGSFIIEGKKVKGKVSHKGGVYQAERLSVRVKKLTTAMELRDKHLREKLEYKKHPKIYIRDVIARGGKGSAEIEVKGIKKNIQFRFQEKGEQLVAEFPLSLKEFKISGINYMGIGVKDQVRVVAYIDK